MNNKLKRQKLIILASSALTPILIRVQQHFLVQIESIFPYQLLAQFSILMCDACQQRSPMYTVYYARKLICIQQIILQRRQATYPAIIASIHTCLYLLNSCSTCDTQSQYIFIGVCIVLSQETLPYISDSFFQLHGIIKLL